MQIRGNRPPLAQCRLHRLYVTHVSLIFLPHRSLASGSGQRRHRAGGLVSPLSVLSTPTGSSVTERLLYRPFVIPFPVSGGHSGLWTLEKHLRPSGVYAALCPQKHEGRGAGLPSETRSAQPTPGRRWEDARAARAVICPRVGCTSPVATTVLPWALEAPYPPLPSAACEDDAKPTASLCVWRGRSGSTDPWASAQKQLVSRASPAPNEGSASFRPHAPISPVFSSAALR